MIVDEVQTGVGATGKFWAHEHWDLHSPPDFVTFAKKMQSSGFYISNKFRCDTPYRHFNTFLGDAVRAKITQAQNKIIKEHNLVALADEVGKYLMASLYKMSKEHQDWI